MSREHFPGGAVVEDSIYATDEFGEKIRVPLSQVSELKPDTYSWGDAMVVTFDDNKGDDDE